MPGSVLSNLFLILAHLIPIMATLWGLYSHLSHFKDGRSKTQTLRNTQGHVPSKWESWILNPSILAPKSRLNDCVVLSFPRFHI